MALTLSLGRLAKNLEEPSLAERRFARKENTREKRRIVQAAFFGTNDDLIAPQVALSALVRRAPDLALVGDGVTYKHNIVLRGMESLPVAMGG